MGPQIFRLGLQELTFMRTITFLISQRYLFARHIEKSISTMIFVCFIGIMIGTFALALVGAIMNGFEQATHATLQSIHPPIIMSAYGNHLNFDALEKVILKEFPAVSALAPRDMQHAIMYDKDQEQTVPLVISVMGIDPDKEAFVSQLPQKISPSAALAALSSGKNILIGHQMANNLSLAPGDTTSLWIAPPEIKHKTITLSEHPVTVAGIFNTGIDEFDSNLVIGSLSFIESLFPDAGVTEIGVASRTSDQEQALIKQLKKRLALDVYSWKELYPAIVAALILEKYAMLLIFALIMLIASTTIIALLFMWITYKRSDIAIFKAMGMSNGDIRQIFFIIGLIIIISACIIGIALAWLTSYMLNSYQLISLPDAYYISHLPAIMNWPLVGIIAAIVIGIGCIALMLPLRSLRKIHIIEVLK